MDELLPGTHEGVMMRDVNEQFGASAAGMKPPPKNLSGSSRRSSNALQALFPQIIPTQSLHFFFFASCFLLPRINCHLALLGYTRNQSELLDAARLIGLRLRADVFLSVIWKMSDKLLFSFVFLSFFSFFFASILPNTRAIECVHSVCGVP